jgi:hypothetical protein
LSHAEARRRGGSPPGLGAAGNPNRRSMQGHRKERSAVVARTPPPRLRASAWGPLVPATCQVRARYVPGTEQPKARRAPSGPAGTPIPLSNPRPNEKALRARRRHAPFASFAPWPKAKFILSACRAAEGREPKAASPPAPPMPQKLQPFARSPAAKTASRSSARTPTASPLPRPEFRFARRRGGAESPCPALAPQAPPPVDRCTAIGRSAPRPSPRLPLHASAPWPKAKFILSACRAVEGREPQSLAPISPRGGGVPCATPSLPAHTHRRPFREPAWRSFHIRATSLAAAPHGNSAVFTLSLSI